MHWWHLHFKNISNIARHISWSSLLHSYLCTKSHVSENCAVFTDPQIYCRKPCAMFRPRQAKYPESVFIKIWSLLFWVGWNLTDVTALSSVCLAGVRWWWSEIYWVSTHKVHAHIVPWRVLADTGRAWLKTLRHLTLTLLLLLWHQISCFKSPPSLLTIPW